MIGIKKGDTCVVWVNRGDFVDILILTSHYIQVWMEFGVLLITVFHLDFGELLRSILTPLVPSSYWQIPVIWGPGELSFSVYKVKTKDDDYNEKCRLYKLIVKIKQWEL